MSRKQLPAEFMGKKYGRLTIIQDLGWPKKHRTVMVLCDCGNVKAVLLGNLNHGVVNSCGCLSKELAIIRNKNRARTHGMVYHPLYNVHKKMKDRCYKHNDKSYYRYGGRGVRVCDEWLNDFTSFYDWAIENGWKKGMHIDKDIKAMKMGIKPLIYSPVMCSVVTPKENTRSRVSSKMVEYKGEIKCVSEWADILDIPVNRLYKRLSQLKMSVEKAFSVRRIATGFKMGHTINNGRNSYGL